MRRFLAWAAGVAGGIAAYRALTRRRPELALPPLPAEPAVDPRAAELRARLDATRDEPEPEPEPTAETPEERRARIHERGRAAVDRMRRSE